MSAENTTDRNPDLQFDRVVSGEESAPESSAPRVKCAFCKRTINAEYFHVNGATVCEACARQAEGDGTTARGSGPLLRSLLFGIGAAIAGAIVYYAVIAITNLEIGIVAILIGWMVGYAVRKGVKGRGGRRYQIIAVALTYWAVGLAYTPLAMKELITGNAAKGAALQSADSSANAVTVTADSAVQSATATSDSAAPASSDSAEGIATPAAIHDQTTASSNANSSGNTSLGYAMLALMGLVFALPVFAIIGSMPGGLISALIIFIGLRQAWQMTGKPALDISGPYKIGAQPSSAS